MATFERFYETDFGSITQKIARIYDFYDLRHSWEFIENSAQRILYEDTERRFETKTAPDGERWKDWSDEYASDQEKGWNRFHRVRYFDDTEYGALQLSKRMQVNAKHGWKLDRMGNSSVDIEFNASNMPQKYWDLQNYGSPNGKIPARPFIGISEEAEWELLDLFDEWVEANTIQYARNVSKQDVLSFYGLSDIYTYSFMGSMVTVGRIAKGLPGAGQFTSVKGMTLDWDYE